MQSIEIKVKATKPSLEIGGSLYKINRVLKYTGFRLAVGVPSPSWTVKDHKIGDISVYFKWYGWSDVYFHDIINDFKEWRLE